MARWIRQRLLQLQEARAEDWLMVVRAGRQGTDPRISGQGCFHTWAHVL